MKERAAASLIALALLASPAAANAATSGWAFSWGSNANGQLSDGSTSNSNVPEPVLSNGSGSAPLTGITAVAAGAAFTLALRSDGTVWAWGANSNGQLGNGTNTPSATPVEVLAGGSAPSGFLSGVTAIAAGGSHSMALLSNGNVYTWGAGGSGQLGDRATKDSSTPVAVLNNNNTIYSGLTAIAAGSNFSAALDSKGEIITFGDNTYDELGNGQVPPTTAQSSTPTFVLTPNGAGVTGATAIALGNHHGLALTSTGGVISWGGNDSGQLGNNSNKNASTVQTVVTNGPRNPAIASVSAIAAGGLHSLAVVKGGGVYAWGNDQQNQLGDNGASVSSGSSLVGIPVAGPGGSGNLTGIASVAAGQDFSLALSIPTTSGAVSGYGWGRDNDGQLGNQGLANAPAPESIAFPTNPVALGGGCCGEHALAVAAAEPAPTITAVAPADGPAAGGTTVTITGTGLQFVNKVLFGSNASAAWSVAGSTQISALTGATTPGPVDVTVTAPAGTSSTSGGDVFAFTARPSPGLPQLPVVNSSTGAAFSGTVDPEGLPTTAAFENGIDSAYRAGGAPIYDHRTPAISAGSDYIAHPVGATVTGLQPNTLYHARLVSTNSQGTAYGTDQTFRTKSDPPPPPPVRGKSVNVVPVSGRVLVELPGRRKFQRLTEGIQIPVNSTVDATKGRVRLTSARTGRHAGATESADFYEGVFKIGQRRNQALTFIKLVGVIAGCPRPRSAEAIPARGKPKRHLWGSGQGQYRTQGGYASASVQGTIWLTADYCNGTLVQVKRGVVSVYEYRQRRTVRVQAGRSIFVPGKP